MEDADEERSTIADSPATETRVFSSRGEPAPVEPKLHLLLKTYAALVDVAIEGVGTLLPFVPSPKLVLASAGFHDEEIDTALAALYARRCILLREAERIDGDDSLPERALIIQPPTENDHVYPTRLLLSAEDMAEIDAMPTVVDGNKDSRCLVNGVGVAEEGDDADSDDGEVPSPDANAHIRVMHDARAALSAMIQRCLEALKHAADDEGIVLGPLRVIEDVVAELHLPAGTAVEFINTLINEGYALTASGYRALQLIQPSAPAERERMAEDDEEEPVGTTPAIRPPQQASVGESAARFRGRPFPPGLLSECADLLRQHATPQGMVHNYALVVKDLLTRREVDPVRCAGVIKRLQEDGVIIHLNREGYLVVSLPAKPGLSLV